MSGSGTVFRWRGRDSSGRKCQGTLRVESERAARVALHRKGIVMHSLRRQSPLSRQRQHLLEGESSDFLRQLAVAVEGGVPLLSALDMLQDTMRRAPSRALLQDLRRQVAAGTSLARALGDYPRVFDESTRMLIDAGEQAGAPGPMLLRAAQYREQSLRLRRRLRQAMLYPAVVIFIAAAVTAVLLLKVVPEFAALFADFGTELPAATRFVISLSAALAAAWLPGAALLAAAGAAAVLLWRHPALHCWRDRQLLRLPLAGPLLRKGAAARFCRVAGAALEAGVPAAEALRAAGRASANRALAAAANAASSRLAGGHSLHAALRAEAAILPPMVGSMAAVGEQSGQLPQMLNFIAGHCEEDAQVLAEQLVALLEPLVIALLGVLVGGLIVAMYLPVFQLGGIG